MKSTIIIISLFVLFSCSQPTSQVPAVDPPSNGNYSGVFTISEGGSTTSGSVTFAFHDSSYQCIPNARYLPPAGGGSYQVKPGVMILTDQMVHTAEFDWTLILNGEFKYSRQDNNLILEQIDPERNRYRKIVLEHEN